MCSHEIGAVAECPECVVDGAIKRDGGEMVAVDLMRHLVEALSAFDRHLEHCQKSGKVEPCEVAAFNGYIQGLEHALSISRGENPWMSKSTPRYV